MRAIIMVIVAAVVLGGGWYFFMRGSPGGSASTSTAMFATNTPTTAAARPASGADACHAQFATYMLRSDPRVRIKFETDGPPKPPRTTGVVGGLIDTGPVDVTPLIFVVQIAAKNTEYRFKAQQTTTGWQHFTLSPIVNGHASAASPPIEVDVFDDNYEPMHGLPQYEGGSPAHIFSPALSQWIYNQGPDRRVDSPVNFFDFYQCVTPPAAPAAPH